MLRNRLCVILSAILGLGQQGQRQEYREYITEGFRFQYPAGWTKYSGGQGVLGVMRPKEGNSALIHFRPVRGKDCRRDGSHATYLGLITAGPDRHWNSPQVTPDLFANLYDQTDGGWTEDKSKKQLMFPAGRATVTRYRSSAGYPLAIWEFVSFCSAGTFALIELRLRNSRRAMAARDLILDSFAIEPSPQVARSESKKPF